MYGDEANDDARRTVDAEQERETARKLLAEGLRALGQAFAQLDKARHCFRSLEWLLDSEAD
jgi:hypothetical protein